jgi:hypothetical protein
MESHALRPGSVEHAVEHERLEVDVQVERPTKALNDGQGGTLAVAHTEPARSLAREGERHVT